MKDSTQAALRLGNEEVVKFICSHGHFSLAAKLRLCSTCELSCPGIRNCPLVPTTTPGAVADFQTQNTDQLELTRVTQFPSATKKSAAARVGTYTWPAKNNTGCSLFTGPRLQPTPQRSMT
jgi:hypothetical protein